MTAIDILKARAAAGVDTSSGGHFHRKPSAFRDTISRKPGAKFPPESGRYYLYIIPTCPWAHRVNITRTLKGLESFIPLVLLHPFEGPDGWYFSGEYGTALRDPLYGFTKLRDFYFKADPQYGGRYTVPMLWDRKHGTIVNNESSELIRMLFTEFDDLLTPELRESAHPFGGYYPPPSSPVRAQIDSMNDWVYDQINNGVYKVGFSTTQKAYNQAIGPLFEGLDCVEAHLSKLEHQPYLFGKAITEADIRLFTTIIRFDVAYFAVFRCTLKMIRYEYPNIDKWMRRLYWDESDRTREAFKKTVFLSLYKPGYALSLHNSMKYGGNVIVPAGPVPDIRGPVEE